MAKIERTSGKVMLRWGALLVVLLAGGFPPVAEGQTWPWLSSQIGPGEESITQLALAESGYLLAGTYSTPLDLGGSSLPHRGENDLFVGEGGPTGQIERAFSLGGPGNDLAAALFSPSSGGFVLAGSFWGTLELPAAKLEVAPGEKALFLAVFESFGQLDWSVALTGTGLKEVTDVGEDKQGNLLVSGYFGGSLQVGSTRLQAAGRNDLFLLSFTPDGDLNWATRTGYRGNTRAIALATGPAGDLFVGGYYDDTTAIGTDTLLANTRDRDVFLAAYSPDGQAKWARRAGGVHDDDLVDLEVDADGKVYATGFFVGVMTLSDDLSIQSSTGLSDVFLLRYHPDGTPEAARAFGGPQVQQPGDLYVAGDGLALAGIFQGAMTVDGRTVSAGSGFGSFVGRFQSDLSLDYLTAASTEEEVYFRSILPQGPSGWVVGGTHRGTFRAGDLSIDGSQGYDMVLGGVQRASTSSPESPSDPGGFLLYPNPARERIQVTCQAPSYWVRIYNLRGQALFTYLNPTEVPLNGLAPGTYWVQCIEPDRQHWRKLLVQP